ncbi:tetratricopeptide (TPR) repeat protein [Bradyrhizobium sp. GM2.4]
MIGRAAHVGLFLAFACAYDTAISHTYAQDYQAGAGAVIIVGPVTNSPISTGGLTDAQFSELKKAFGTQSAALSESQQKEIKYLEEKLSLTEAQIALAFSKMGEKDVPPAKIGEKLAEFAQKYKTINIEFERLSGRYESFKAVRSSASQMINDRRFSDARDVIQRELAKTTDAQLEAAELTALQGMLVSLEFRYGEAASLYQAAAALSTSDPAAMVRYTLLQVTDLIAGADEHTRRDYLADSVRALERTKATPSVANSEELVDQLNKKLAAVLAVKWNMERDKKDLEQAKSILQEFSAKYPPGSETWRSAQSGLATLYQLSDQAQAAVSIYKALLNQGGSADSELGIYMNLSALLGDLGYANSDVSVLKQAKEYGEKAMAADGQLSSRPKSLLRYNLGIVIFKLGDVSKDAPTLREAAERFKEALTYVTKDSDPISFANTNMNLGTTYLTLARLEQPSPTSSSYELAIKSCDQALTVWRREERLHSWRQTQFTKVFSLLEWTQSSPNEKRLSEALDVLNDMKKDLDPESDSEALVSTEIMIGDDAYAMQWLQDRREPSRQRAKRSYELAKSHIVLNLLDMSGMRTGLELGHAISARLEKLQGSAKRPSSNKEAKKQANGHR